MAHRVESSIRINATADKVWETLDDFGGVEKFSVGVERSPILGEKTSGIGAKRHCVFYDKSSVIEEIIEYDPKNSFKVSLTEFSMPLKSMHAKFKVEKFSDTSCEVTLSMIFVVKFGPIGVLMGMVMMRPLMKGVQKKMLSGLAYHVVTGKNIRNELPSSDELAQAIVVAS